MGMSYRLRPLLRLGFARLPSWQQAMLLLVGVAFFLQGYVTQTHIHPLAPASNRLASFDSNVSVKADKPDRGAPSRDRPAPNDDPAKCPLCQAVGHAGQFVWPHAAVFILPQLSAAIVPIVAAIVRAAAPDSHNWQSRAPPRL
jgi:hypothetical protein